MTIVRAAGNFAVLLFFVSCGIEDYPYLEQIPPANVSRPASSTAAVSIGSRDGDGVFLHYSIFYRIYISDVALISTIAESELSRINSALYSDFTAMKPYTDASNNLAANTGSLFSSRNYFEIELLGSDINNTFLSDKGSFTLNFDFSDTQSRSPVIYRSGGGEFILARSTGSGLFNPQPRFLGGTFDGRFVNSDGLNSSENATTTVNRDVATKSISSGATRYTYASLYICAVGINGTTLVPVYSAPTYIGTFLLPEQWWQGTQEQEDAK
ncbi:MAG: hypothetical protein LBG72_00965 [Spirochaetaceae bacterium]|nr:hypothetical protein [Spirochaetaceae bacterium]